MNPAISQSLSMARLLRSRSPEDPAWVEALDRYFLAAAFEDRSAAPFVTGPYNLDYYGFHAARSYDVEFLDFQSALHTAVQRVAGGILYPGGGMSEWVYSPGDIVSLSQYRTSVFQWTGAWGADPDFSDYSSGAGVDVGRPSGEFLSPLAARSLEFILRRIFRSEPSLNGRVPGVAFLRPKSRTRPEEASELIVNVFLDDFANPGRAEEFPGLVKWFLPSHLRRRLVNFESRLVPESEFTALETIITEGGLQPAHDAARA